MKMTPNELALANCGIRSAYLRGAANYCWNVSMERGLALYRDAAQIEMMRDYLYRIAYNLPH